MKHSHFSMNKHDVSYGMYNPSKNNKQKINPTRTEQRNNVEDGLVQKMASCMPMIMMILDQTCMQCYHLLFCMCFVYFCLHALFIPESHHTQTTNKGYSRKPDGGFFTS